MGASNYLAITYSSSGKVISELKSSSRSITNVTKLNIHKRKVVCLSGDSCYLDVFSQGAGGNILFKLIY